MRDDWAPYRDGHWAWPTRVLDLVDDAPWGFAVSHYGRWASILRQPAGFPARSRRAPFSYPAPAVAFIDVRQGGCTTGATNGAAGWFPLGPRDVYRPGYKVSQTHFTRIMSATR